MPYRLPGCVLAREVIGIEGTLLSHVSLSIQPVLRKATPVPAARAEQLSCSSAATSGERADSPGRCRAQVPRQHAPLSISGERNLDLVP
jgi:hypothetical protein